MFVEIITDVGGTAPLRIPCSQIVVRRNDGTPISLAAVFGPDGAIAVSIAGNDDFNRLLAALGVHTTVIADYLELPKPPPGARLVAGPGISGE